MIIQTSYQVSPNLLIEANKFNFADNKAILNDPTDNFFYDPWVIKDQYKGTIWDEILDRKSTRLNSSHTDISRMPSSA